MNLKITLFVLISSLFVNNIASAKTCPKLLNGKTHEEISRFERLFSVEGFPEYTSRVDGKKQTLVPLVNFNTGTPDQTSISHDALKSPATHRTYHSYMMCAPMLVASTVAKAEASLRSDGRDNYTPTFSNGSEDLRFHSPFHTSPDDTHADFYWLTEEVFPELGLLPEKVNKDGMTLGDTEEAIKAALKIKGIKAQTKIQSAESRGRYKNKGFTLEDIKAGIHSNKAVLILVDHYNHENPHSTDKSRAYGHMLQVVGYDEANPNIVYVQDPAKPRKVIVYELEALKPAEYETPTFRVHSRGMGAVMTLIQGILTVDFKETP